MPNNSNRRSNEPDRTKRTGTPQARRAKSGNRSKSGNRTAEARKVNPSGQNKRKAKGKKKNGNNHEKLKMALKIAVIIFLLLCVVGAGVVAGIFFGLFGDDFEITKEELKIGASNSVVVDANGAVISNFSGDEKRKIVKLEDM